MIFSRKKRSTPTRRPRRRVRGVERLEERTLLTAAPFGATEVDTGDYMLGDVYVTVVGFESNGTIDPNLEDWNQAYLNEVKGKIQTGLQWWEDTLDIQFPNHQHELNFQIDFTYLDSPIATGYEPINRISDDFQLWTADFFRLVGFNTGDFSSNSRAFNNAQRETHGTDWAFTIFIANDQNDPDGRFAFGGSFDRAFSFAGGRFFIAPAHRPDSTFAHETGHMFWARDEYAGGGHYDEERGYYNAQNYNAADNPAFTSGAEQRQLSIMDRGACDENSGLLCDAFRNHTSSDSSFAMIGWRDSDGDGLFDVLDVPLALEGVGSFDATEGEYHFVGTSSVQTLPNLNSFPFQPQNDSTINHVGLAEFRIDGGAWQAAQRYDDYTANLDLTIPAAAGQQIEIRTLDDRTSPVTGVSSPIFTGTTDRPASTLLPGINGFVWHDEDADGNWDAGETALANRTVRLVDQNGNPVTLARGVEPDDYPDSSTWLNNIIPEVTLSAIMTGSPFEQVVSLGAPAFASTGSRVFANPCSGPCVEWTNTSRLLRMDFADPVTTVSIDAIASSANDQGRLEIYDANDNLLARYTTGKLPSGAVETMTLNRPTAEIAYAIAGAHADRTILLDNLRFGPRAEAVTDAHGVYRLPYLEPDTYLVQLLHASGDQPTLPASGRQTVSLAAGQALAEVDFGVSTSGSRWQNRNNRFDVNNDGFVTPNDVLLIVNRLNSNGPQTLSDEPTPPYLDVNGDGLVTANDVLQVVNAINSQGDSEGEAGASFAPPPISPGAGAPEAEASPQTPGGGNAPAPPGAPPADLFGQTMVTVYGDRAVSHLRHPGWRFVGAADDVAVTTDARPSKAGFVAPAKAETDRRRLRSHDQVLQRLTDADEALLPTDLDDALLDQLAVAKLGRS